ncbi:MAG: glycosyltransferase [Phycisphaerales bacterium]|nr:glycosyltransferase [Phycisphaerales bacterium]
MRPLVSLILPLAPAALDAIASVQAQSLEDWELMVVAPPETDLRPVARLADPRIHLLISDRPGPASAWNSALPMARGRFIVFMEPRDRLTPEGLSLLVHAAERSPQGAAFGEYRFTAPIGELPADPLAGTGEEIGLADLLRASPLIPPAQILRRDLLNEHRFREDLESAADIDLFLQLAVDGLRWRRVFGRIATRALAPLADDRAALHEIWTHLRLFDAVADRRPDVPSPIREDLYRAYLLLAAFDRAAKNPRQLASLVAFGSTYPRWWQRHGFRGPAPRHLLPAACDFTSPEHADFIAEQLLESCQPGAPIILLGLGRNARRIAARLHQLGLPVIGRDDGLTAPPAWSAQDRIPVTLLPATSPYDPRASYLMTILNDDAYLARLPGGLRISRWRDMPALLDREWREAIRGRSTTDGPWIPPAPSRGAFASQRRTLARAEAA